MYATVEDLRAEGVTAAESGDARLEALLEEATSFIDRVTGWFFEPRRATYRLDGRGRRTLELPVPPIEVEWLRVGEADVDLEDVLVFGAPVLPGLEGPRLVRRVGVFPRGLGNVEVGGVWGFTEADGSLQGRTPPAIRRACLLLVLRWLHPLADDLADDARNRWRVIEERTRDQSIKLDRVSVTGAYTGDAEIDSLLELYRRPVGLGAV